MFFGKRRPRFGDVAEVVLRLKKLKSEETRRAAGQWIPRLVKSFGELPVDEVTEELWADYVIRERGIRERKFFDDRKYMRMILRFAEKRELVPRRIELPIPDPPWNAGREITPLELSKLIKVARPTLRFQIQIAWKMGLRLREMLRLRWDQFDWGKKTIRFQPIETKTRRFREVPLTPDLVPGFKARLAQNAALFVFPSPGDTSRPQNSNKTAWRACKTEAQVKARWHDLRHTCATRMLRAGVKPHVVRKYLGMSERVLFRIYAHLNVEDLKAAAAVMRGSPRKKI